MRQEKRRRRPRSTRTGHQEGFASMHEHRNRKRTGNIGQSATVCHSYEACLVLFCAECTTTQYVQRRLSHRELLLFLIPPVSPVFPMPSLTPTP